MITPDREHAKAGQQIEIARTLAVVEILPLPLLEADIVANGLENPNELLVQIPIMQRAPLGLTVREQLRHVWIWTIHPLHTSVEGRFVN
jgi:hypothetical protein